MFRKIALGLGVLVGTAAALVVIYVIALVVGRESAQRQIAERRTIANENGIEVSEIIEIGGIPQYINIRGRDQNNPILLYLHGGPGTPMTPMAHVFQDSWEDHFTVVHWDQRGAGKTYRLTPPEAVAETMSFERMEDDVVELTDYLRDRFGQEKIFLLGHSWGSIVGLPVAKANPEKYHAYIGTGQTIHPMKSETLGYERTLMLARKIGHKRAIEELRALAPYPQLADALEKSSIRHKWNAYFGESIFGYQNLGDALIEVAINSPDYDWIDLWTLAQEDQSPYKALDNNILTYDAYRYGTDWPIPVLFLQGRHDWQVNHQLVKEYYEAIDAPFKAFFYINDSAHAPMISQPDAFADILIEFVAPLASVPAHQNSPSELFVDGWVEGVEKQPNASSVP